MIAVTREGRGIIPGSGVYAVAEVNRRKPASLPVVVYRNLQGVVCWVRVSWVSCVETDPIGVAVRTHGPEIELDKEGVSWPEPGDLFLREVDLGSC